MSHQCQWACKLLSLIVALIIVYAGRIAFFKAIHLFCFLTRRVSNLKAMHHLCQLTSKISSFKVALIRVHA
eukprot:12405827-Karenia_brevis.AAC.1